MTLVAELAASLHDAHVLFVRVGETDYANSAVAGKAACAALLDQGEAEVDDKGLVAALRSAAIRTSQRLATTRVAGVVLDAISPFWDVLPTLWAQDKKELSSFWDKAMADVAAFAAAHGVSVEDAPAEIAQDFVQVSPVPASEGFVAALQQLSGVDPALRLMFIEAQDPDTVWHAVVVDESSIDSVLRPFPYTLWRGEADLGEAGVVYEFRVYTVKGHRIFRMTGHLAACSKAILDALKSGEFLPRMANMKTASVIRMTFTLRAMTDPQFRDFLRSMGGVPASPVSWDIPIYAEADVEKHLEAVKSGFGYTVSIYQVIDTPEQNIYASANPEGHVARLLSAEVVDVVTDSNVEAPSLSDLAQRVASVLPEVTGTARKTLEQVALAGRIHAHYVVARTGEIRPQTGKFACKLGDMFSCPRTEAKPAKVVVFAGSSIPQIVTTDVLK